MPVQIAIDIGNTQAKVGVFNEHLYVDSYVIPSNEINEVLRQSDRPIILSSVGDDVAPELLGDHVHVLNHETPLPIKIDYETPHTLGVDRIANSCGTLAHGDGNWLVIDAGSCITYDLVKNGTFIGGSITPGVQMRFKVMHNFTAKLPLTELDGSNHFPSSSTQGNLQSGVWEGIVGEMQRMIDLAETQISNVNVILTGGDHTLFVKAMKSSTFADPKLTLRGLNEILLYISK